MIAVRRADERGHFDHGWLKTWHTFAFAGYQDRRHVRFRTLRVINEDIVKPGAGFGEHPHDNMEILTYIVSGALAHQDDAGHAQEIKPGDVQHMSAGTGIHHSEFNPSRKDPVHLLQIWIFPDEKGHKPGYDQKHFDEASRRNKLRLVASPDGADGSIRIHQDAKMYASLLGAGHRVEHAVGSGRGVWLQIVKGEVVANGQRLGAGDGASVEDEAGLTIEAAKDAEFLLFDLK